MSNAKYNDLSNLLTGQDIRDYIACGGTLAELDEVKEDIDNWADATAEFEWERREAYLQQSQFQVIDLFIQHPY